MKKPCFHTAEEGRGWGGAVLKQGGAAECPHPSPLCFVFLFFLKESRWTTPTPHLQPVQSHSQQPRGQERPGTEDLGKRAVGLKKGIRLEHRLWLLHGEDALSPGIGVKKGQKVLEK